MSHVARASACAGDDRGPRLVAFGDRGRHGSRHAFTRAASTHFAAAVAHAGALHLDPTPDRELLAPRGVVLATAAPRASRSPAHEVAAHAR
jgi:hypothetical protein